MASAFGFNVRADSPRPLPLACYSTCVPWDTEIQLSAIPSDLLASSMVAEPIKCVSLTSQFVCNDRTMLFELSIKLRHVCTDEQLHSLSNLWKRHASGETLYFQTALFFQFNVTLSF